MCSEENCMCLVLHQIAAQCTWKTNVLYGSFSNSFPGMKIIGNLICTEP